MTAKKDKAEEPNFEKSMERLESIVADMEGGELSLDAMIKRFEEGQSLIKFCGGKLDEVERRIEILLTKEGEPETEPFGDESKEGEDASDDNVPEKDELLF